MTLDGVAKRLERERSGLGWLAWHIEALRRQRDMPDLERLMAVKKKAQSVDDMIIALDAWANRYNAVYLANFVPEGGS